jgi:hypothetical protein
MRIGESPLKGSFSMLDFNNPQVKGHLEMNLDIASLGEVFPVSENITMIENGSLDLVANVKGKSNDFSALALKGEISLDNILVRTPSLLAPIEVPSSIIEFDTKNLTMSRCSLKAGTSEVRLEGSIEDYLSLLSLARISMPISPPASRAALDIEIHSKELDLNELIAREKSSARETKVKETPVKRSNVLLPDLDFKGTVRIDKILYKDHVMEKVRINALMRDQVAVLDEVSMEVYSGNIRCGGNADFRKPFRFPFEISVSAKKVKAGDFLSTITPFGDHLHGQFSVNGNFSGALDSTLSVIRKELVGRGDVTLVQGKLVNWEPVKKIGETIKYGRWNEFVIDSWRGGFRVLDERLHIENVKVAAETGDWESNGSVGFDETIDLTVESRLSRNISDKMSGEGLIGKVSGFIKDEDSRIRTKFHMGGTVKDPRITFDSSFVKTRLDMEKKKLQDAAKRKLSEERERAKREVEDKKKRAAEEVKEKLKSEKEKTEEKLKEGLKKIFK